MGALLDDDDDDDDDDDSLSRLHATVTTTSRLRFDNRSTAHQRSLRSHWHNQLAAVTLTYLFIYLGRSEAADRQAYVVLVT